MTKVYAVAQSVPEGVSGFITAGKQYEVIGGTSRWFGFIDDEGCRITTDWSQSRILNGGNWTRIEAEEPAAEAPADATIAALAEANAEIARLRGLLIDPGNPAWEDARAILAAELDKAGLTDRAASVRHGHADYVPSWIALNLIAQAARQRALEGVRQ